MKSPIRWLGGKAKLLPEILKRVPDDLNTRTYHEPFLGGGSVLLAMLPLVPRARANDLNWALIETWKALKLDVDGVIQELLDLQRNTTEEAYYLARAELNELMDGKFPRTPDVRMAAVFIYVNKTCFNGLFRVNKSGGFNTPWGKREGTQVFVESHLRMLALRLNETPLVLENLPYGDALAAAAGDSFVYLDPPYPPASKTADFTNFTAGGFGDLDQLRLATAIREAAARGAKLMLSMPHQPFVTEMYRGFQRHEVRTRRSVSARSAGRGTAGELLITNY